MKSYIKLYGPPLGEALKALRKVAVDFPEVCVMDQSLAASLGVSSVTSGLGVSASPSTFDSVDMVMGYFGGPESISEERCDTIISKSGESLGEFDFYYEWFQKPTIAQIEDLITKIDKALASIGVRYTITTK